MEKATISEIKNHLSAYLKKVKAGQSILILDRDQPVARLERVAREQHPDDRLSRLERAGLIRRATQPVPIKALKAAAPNAKHGVLQALMEERREGRGDFGMLPRSFLCLWASLHAPLCCNWSNKTR